MERSTLKAMEETEMVKRGSAYIEGLRVLKHAIIYIWVSLSIAITGESLVFLGF